MRPLSFLLVPVLALALACPALAMRALEPGEDPGQGHGHGGHGHGQVTDVFQGRCEDPEGQCLVTASARGVQVLCVPARGEFPRWFCPKDSGVCLSSHGAQETRPATPCGLCGGCNKNGQNWTRGWP